MSSDLRKRKIKAEEFMTIILRLAVGLMIFFGCTAMASEWQVETIDQSGVGKFSSMKIDKEGNLHVVYVIDDSERDPVKYGFWDHQLKRWFLMDIARGGSVCSLTLDSKQHPHISYVDAGSQPGAKLHYGHWDGTTWKIQAVPLNAEIIAYYNSIALDAQDRPSISFYEYTGPKGSDFRVRMRVVKWNGKYWEVATVDGDNQSGKFNALAIDAQGHTHLAYANVNGMTAGMRYAFWDGTSWKPEILEGLPSLRAYVGYSACIALDKDGDPHVSYSHYDAPFYVKYAVRKGGHWQIQVVDKLSGVGYPDRNSIFLDDAGQPYITYFDARQGTLKLAHRVGQKWVAETVDSNGVGFTSSVQIDRGVIWISYADEGQNGFKVAHRPLAPGNSTVTAAGSVQTTRQK
jgi:hypothetical protein